MVQEGAAISTGAHGRRYDIDALRVLPFALLILYHVAMLRRLVRARYVLHIFSVRLSDRAQ